MIQEKEIYWLQEIGKEYNDLVGKKCANLGEVHKIGLPTPQGFALSVKAEERFLCNTNARNEIKNSLCYCNGIIKSLTECEEVSKKLREIVEKKEMPEDFKLEILSYYERLCEQCGCEVAVSVRSAGTLSHPGQYETYLNVKGKDDLIEKILKVWSSTYNGRTLATLSQKDISVWDSPSIGVCVLQMVNAEAAGVCFTVEPTTGDDSRMLIEANWGLGESVVSGSSIPDRFVVDKQTSTIIEKVLGQKGAWVIPTAQGVVQQKVPESKQGQYCIDDHTVKNICDLSKKLEDHFGVPQDVEWAYNGSTDSEQKVMILQTRPQVGVQCKRTVSDQILDCLISKLEFG